MTKRFCDRCGQLCNGLVEGKYRIGKDFLSYLDLCDNCKKELEDWFDNGGHQDLQEQLGELWENTPEPKVFHVNPAKNVKSPSLSVQKIFGKK